MGHADFRELEVSLLVNKLHCRWNDEIMKFSLYINLKFEMTGLLMKQ